MSDVTKVDNMPRFVSGSDSAMDRALNRMAIDLERLSKAVVPFDKGQLKASGYHRRIGFMRYRMGFNKVYAAYQEFGGGGGRVVRFYSHAGKKAHYLGDTGKTIASKAISYFHSEGANIHI